LVRCFGQSGDPAGGRGERDAVPGVGGGDRQRGGQVGLTRAGWAEEHDVAGFGEPAAGFQSGDLGAVEGGLGGEVEVGDRLDRREPGVSDALAGTGFGACFALSPTGRTGPRRELVVARLVAVCFGDPITAAKQRGADRHLRVGAEG
jgi:hypothetical protein